MRIRGRRECRECGTRWSYYETGGVTCPECGSVASRGLDEQRVLHTASPAELDLSEARAAVDDRPPWEAVDEAKSACREYVARQGFVRGGDLLALSETYVAARELIHAADLVGRSVAPTDPEEEYLLALLAGAEDGDRPAPDAVPESLRSARGLAVAEAVRDYRSEVGDWLEANPHPEVERHLGRLREHDRRLAALGGDVDPRAAERLLATARDLGAYLRSGEEAALSAAADRLDGLDEDPPG